MTHPDTDEFAETQSFPAWVGALLFAATAIAGLGAYAAARETGAPAGPGLLAVLAGLLTVMILFGGLRLTTTANGEGVRVKGFLFIDRRIPYGEIASATARRYRPIMEYGGWGYRLGPSGKAYNARGDEGVQLVLKTGGRVLIGSQRAEELARLISARLGG